VSKTVSAKNSVLWLGFLLSFIAFMHSFTAFASAITLAWDPPTTNTDGTPLTNLAGYKIYYGTTSGSYTNTIDAGNVTASVVTDLVDGLAYYFAVTAYNSAGGESSFSNEISKTTPVPQFTLKTFTITENGGSITPAGVTMVNFGANQTVTVAPSAGYHVATVLVDGVSTGAITTYTFTNITADHSIEVIFAINTYTITTEAGTGGAISPSGALSANCGGNATFSITPNTGYTTTDVKVDGVSRGAVTTYTFSNITTSHIISAIFGALPLSSSLTCPDPGVPCVERTDGLPDGNNLVNNKPKVDVEFEFQTMVVDPGGTPQYVRLFMAQRSAPVPCDFFRYDMNCSGNFSTGANCTYRTELGPAANHKFYIEAKLSDGSLVVYPQAGYIDGPQIEMLNGYNFVGAPRDLSGVLLDGTNAFGTASTFRWVPGGTTTNSNQGEFETVDTTKPPVKPGEGYVVWRSNNPTLPGLDLYPNLLDETFTVSLQPGWNIISNPYDGNIKLADIQVQQGTDAAVSWMEAASNTWLNNAIYYPTGIDWGNTYSLERAGGTTDAILVPWRAYWVYLNKADAAYSLVIPKPY
jgi:hypothetical protein